METAQIFLMILLLATVLVLLYLAWNLSQGIQSAQTQAAVLNEKVSHLEQNQNALTQLAQNLATSFSQTGAATGSLIGSATAIREELARAKEGLTELQTQARTRQDVEQQMAESIKRLELVIAGTKAKGSAGENILDVVFAKLPIEWQVRNFKVGNKSVEFALRLPNNLILPIDSKWPATGLLEKLSSSLEPVERQKLNEQIESVVFDKAKEVKKYIDPGITVNFGIAAVPDSVYEVCSGILVEIFKQNVVLVGYSMFLPYLLLVFQTVLSASRNIDLEKLNMYLQGAQDSVKVLQEELEGRFSRCISMLGNSRDHMALHVSKVSSGLTSLSIGSGSLTKEEGVLP